MKQESPFKTEADLCTAFTDWLKKFPEWTAYAETEGWDILLAHVDGTQVGIQAKLRFNMSVLRQAIEGWGSYHVVGPDFRAILVPENDGDRDLCCALGLTLIRPRTEFRTGLRFEPDLTAVDRWGGDGWHFNNPEKRHPLPRFVPDVPAGVPSPVPLTKWKIACLQVCAVLELRGYVTRNDFVAAGIDHRRWKECWLDPVPDRAGAWKWRAERPLFEASHPIVYPKVKAEVIEKRLHAEVPGQLL